MAEDFVSHLSRISWLKRIFTVISSNLFFIQNPDCQGETREEKKTGGKETGTDAVHNPHDRFFKEMFSSKEIARSFLIHYLPDEISQLIDTDSVNLSKNSYRFSKNSFRKAAGRE
ncbi:MAG: Rpn family recombination-promoting nuclease/putative transposase [Desulfatirhabdiaceae bacterium]